MHGGLGAVIVPPDGQSRGDGSPGVLLQPKPNPQAFGVVSFHLSPLPTKPLRLSSLSCRLDCQGVCRAPDKYPRSGNVLQSVG